MTPAIFTAAQLAEMFGVDEEKVLEWRLRYSWPSFKIGRQVRFTGEHLEQIIAKHSGGDASPVVDDGSEISVLLEGQTKRSASARRAS